MLAPAAVKLVAGPKFEPVIVIVSPPVVRSPERGSTSNTIGAAYDVVASVDIALLWPPTMTTHECDAPTPATVVHVIVVWLMNAHVVALYTRPPLDADGGSVDK